MKRWMFGILSALSLLLCVAMCVQWVRSHWRADAIGVVNDLGFTRCAAVHRSTLYLFQTHSHAGEEVRRWHRESRPAAAFDTTATDLRAMWRERRSRFGIERVRDDVRSPGLSGTGYVMWRVPLWMLAAAIGAAALAAAFPWLRSRARAWRGLCPSCGYDLRATPERCPECGGLTAGAATA